MTAKRGKANALGVLAISALALALSTQVWANEQAPASTGDNAARRLSIQVGDRRVAALMHGAPDVYVSGVIDPGAPSRFLAMMKTGQVPVGSNVYLNSPGGSLIAGLTLGRLFRAGKMTTFIGVPPFVSGSGSRRFDKSVMCASACAYAYLGGMWRWAPATGAPFGVHQFYLPNATAAKVGDIEEASGVVVAYLHEMDINPDVFTLASTATPNHVVWLNGSEMLQFGLANNGVAPLTAEYKLLDGTAYLTLDQWSQDGEHKIVILCAPANVTLMALYIVGRERAEQIVDQGVRSYFSVDGKETFAAGRGNVQVTNGAVTFDRQAPKSFLGALTQSRSMGAWVDDENGAFRTGFKMNLGPVRSKVQNYYENCVGSTVGGVQ